MFDRNMTTYRIYIPTFIMDKLIELNDLEKNKRIEYQYYLLCDANESEDIYEVEDIWVPYQESSGTLTEEKLDDDVQKMFEQRNYLNGYKLIKCHSHHTMSAFSSATDIKEATKSLNLQMVHNHDGDYVVYNDQGRCKAELHIDDYVGWKLDAWEKCNENLDERLGHKVTPVKTYPFYNTLGTLFQDDTEEVELTTQSDDIDGFSYPCGEGESFDYTLCCSCPEYSKCYI